MLMGVTRMGYSSPIRTFPFGIIATRYIVIVCIPNSYIIIIIISPLGRYIYADTMTQEILDCIIFLSREKE